MPPNDNKKPWQLDRPPDADGSLILKDGMADWKRLGSEGRLILPDSAKHIPDAPTPMLHLLTHRWHPDQPKVEFRQVFRDK